MAATAYYVKSFEDDSHVEYRYGRTEDDLSKSFLIEKAALRPDIPDGPAGMTARLALSRIVRTFRERGEWPERGANFT